MSATGETSGRADGRRRAPVMSDVAKLAGVSHQTVSRVINGSPQVRAATRERVLAAMRELDYRPNSAARALVTGRSQTLGVVSFDTTLFGPASTLYAIERAAHDAGLLHHASSASRRWTAPRCSARSSGCACWAWTASSSSPRWRAPARRSSPSRATSRSSRSRRVPADALPVVAVDQLAGAALATRHLLELGHPTVAHIGGPPDFLEAVQRVDGWRVHAWRPPGAVVPPRPRSATGARARATSWAAS